jgi:opacity protein-like surface antigen
MYPRTPPLALTALALVACQGTPVDGEALSLVYGERVYASGDIDPADEQDVAGLEYTRPAAGYQFELGFLTSAADEDLGGGRFEVSSLEAYGGLRHLFGHSGDPFRPYLSAGVSALRVERDSPIDADDEDELDVGLYLRLGAYAPLGDSLRLGLDLRWFTEEPFTFGDVDTRHRQVGLTLGFGF